MINIIFVIIVLIVQSVAPSYISILIFIANCFVPDSVPLIDEVLGLIISIGKLKSD